MSHANHSVDGGRRRSRRGAANTCASRRKRLCTAGHDVGQVRLQFENCTHYNGISLSLRSANPCPTADHMDGTFLHFSLQSSLLNICCHHQDLQSRPSVLVGGSFLGAADLPFNAFSLSLSLCLFGMPPADHDRDPLTTRCCGCPGSRRPATSVRPQQAPPGCEDRDQ